MRWEVGRVVEEWGEVGGVRRGAYASVISGILRGPYAAEEIEVSRY